MKTKIKKLTLCLIYKPPKILLGMKKRGFGKDLWNGFGGKIEEGETPEQAAIREVQEEIGITPLKLAQRGKMYFKIDNPKENLEVFLYSASEYEGRPQETDEMRPQWFKESKIPYDKMWPEDKHWYPHFLTGKNFNVYAHYKNHETLLGQKVEEI